MFFFKVTDKEETKILNIFNKMGNKEKQDTYNEGLIVINDVARCKLKDKVKLKYCVSVSKECLSNKKHRKVVSLSVQFFV